MLEMLSAFSLEEHDHGLSLRPKVERDVKLIATEPPTVIKERVGVRILSVTGHLWVPPTDKVEPRAA